MHHVDAKTINDALVDEICNKGDPKIIIPLMQDDRADPGKIIRYYLYCLSNMELLRLLVYDKRVKKIDFDRGCFALSMLEGYLAQVKRGIQQGIHELIDNITITYYAIQSDSEEIIQAVSRFAYNSVYSCESLLRSIDLRKMRSFGFLLGNIHLVHFNEKLSSMIFDAAVRSNNLQILSGLLGTPFFAAALKDNAHFRTDIQLGHTEMVRMLVNDPRVNAVKEYEYAAQMAVTSGDVELLKIILADERAYINVTPHLLKCCDKYPEMEAMLREHKSKQPIFCSIV